MIFLRLVKNSMLTYAYSYDLTVYSFGKVFAHERNWLLTKKHMAHWIESWNWIKHWRILYENDTKRRIQLCVKIKKRRYTDLLHFSTRKHNLVKKNSAEPYFNIIQRRISFILGYLRMILWKISIAISIKHRILATFNTNKSILTAYMPLTNWKF
jgi:hypothetical protein